MEKNYESLNRFCYYFYHADSFPVYLLNGSQICSQYPSIPSAINPLPGHLDQILSSKDSVSYLVTKEFVYYGKISLSNSPFTLIIGPISSTLYSRESLHAIMRESSIPHKKEQAFTEFIQQIPVISFNHFLNILCYLHYLLNNEEKTPDQLTDTENHTYEVPVSKMHAANYFIAKEEQHFHNTHNFEQEMLERIEKGDPDGLRRLIEQPLALRAGIVADNNLRQIKNLFISSITLITRAAVRGGLDVETAYQLSDIYIREMEKLTNQADINTLQMHSLNDFANRVRNAQIPDGITPVIYNCIQYISQHTNYPLTVQMVADSVGMSRSYLSRRFKEEMGFNMNHFILRCKLEEAKSLLKFTDKAVSEISNYLCFSSQSYFQNVFKKKYGMTPKEFRET